MTTTPPTSDEIDAWFQAYLTNSSQWPVPGIPWGQTIHFVVCAWTDNTGSQTFQLLDPTLPAGSGDPVNTTPDPLWLAGVNLTYGIAVRCYTYSAPSVPTAVSLYDATLTATKSSTANWAAARLTRKGCRPFRRRWPWR